MLCSIFNLIEKEELSEKEWEEVFDKWSTQLRQNNGDLKELHFDTYRISKKQTNRVRAVGILVEEFVVKTLAETAVRWIRGY